MHASAQWCAQDNWPGSTDHFSYAIHCMLFLANQFAKGWDDAVVFVDIYVLDTMTQKQVATVHFDNPSYFTSPSAASDGA